jgi:hypothetical protein
VEDKLQNLRLKGIAPLDVKEKALEVLGSPPSTEGVNKLISLLEA